jgi:hypothetical protein
MQDIDSNGTHPANARLGHREASCLSSIFLLAESITTTAAVLGAGDDVVVESCTALVTVLGAPIGGCRG